jgi:hypothetical protein
MCWVFSVGSHKLLAHLPRLVLNLSPLDLCLLSS